MTTTKDLLNTKQHTLLTELESIKNLLDDQEADNIPLLQDSIITKEPEIETTPSVTAGVLPGQRSLFKESKFKDSKFNEARLKSELKSENIPLKTFSNNHPRNDALAVPEKESGTTGIAKSTNTSSLSNNPFLPAHVRQRLQRDANNEQSSDDEKRVVTVNASYTQHLVDQLVAHHLPKIEQELRRKLLEVVKNHNDTIKK
jgi:hypothetical protein